MKTTRKSYTGMRPIFTGSPSIVQGGFNLDVEGQRFAVGDIVPAGSLAIYDEMTRKVQIVKTAKVVAIDGTNKKRVSLQVMEFYAPIFAVGDAVLKAGAGAVEFSSVPTIAKIEKTDTKFVVELSAEISGLAVGDVLEEVISDGQSSAKSKEIGLAHSVTICDVVVGEYETAIDVCDDTMQYKLYERRVPPIPASQKDETGRFLKANPNVKLTQALA